jgi:hypothetical protein
VLKNRGVDGSSGSSSKIVIQGMVNPRPPAPFTAALPCSALLCHAVTALQRWSSYWTYSSHHACNALNKTAMHQLPSSLKVHWHGWYWPWGDEEGIMAYLQIRFRNNAGYPVAPSTSQYVLSETRTIFLSNTGHGDWAKFAFWKRNCYLLSGGAQSHNFFFPLFQDSCITQ